MSARTAIAAVALAACIQAPTTIDEVPCPTAGTTLTYDNFGKELLREDCQWCHASDSTDRHGAPDWITFDSLDEVHAHLGRIFARAAADNTTMPPGPDDPPAATRAQLAEWLACGAP